MDVLRAVLASRRCSLPAQGLAACALRVPCVPVEGSLPPQPGAGRVQRLGPLAAALGSG